MCMSLPRLHRKLRFVCSLLTNNSMLLLKCTAQTKQSDRRNLLRSGIWVNHYQSRPLLWHILARISFPYISDQSLTIKWKAVSFVALILHQNCYNTTASSVTYLEPSIERSVVSPGVTAFPFLYHITVGRGLPWGRQMSDRVSPW